MTMNLEQALSELERSQSLAAVEFIIAHPDKAEPFLLARLKQAAKTSRTSGVFPQSPLYVLLSRMYFILPRRRTSVSREIIRRFVIALGAIRSLDAIPILLELLARFPMDAKLGEAIGWALANIGEAAVIPTYTFARARDKPIVARAIAMVALGYMADMRVPTILGNLWREYSTRQPRLALAALIGLFLRGQAETARARAIELERTWQARERNRFAWSEDLRVAATSLAHTLDKLELVEALPLWQEVLHVIG